MENFFKSIDLKVLITKNLNLTPLMPLITFSLVDSFHGNKYLIG